MGEVVSLLVGIAVGRMWAWLVEPARCLRDRPICMEPLWTGRPEGERTPVPMAIREAWGEEEE